MSGWPSQSGATSQDFAFTQTSYIDQERRSGVREAIAYLHAGQPGRAQFVLARTVERQNRIAGNGTIPIEPLCACGGRCNHGSAVS